MAFYYAATFSGWDSVISSFSCLGSVVTYNPMVMAGLHLNAMMALAASVLGFGSILAL